MGDENVKICRWLYPLSWVYQAATGLRNKLYDCGVFRSCSFGVPTICIGNLAVGGTGKTPHTEYLIRLLAPRCRVAVLSRGYKRKTSGYVLADAHSTAASIGDEPWQMHAKFPEAVVAVDEDRCHGIARLLELGGSPVGVVLLDDAFQHRRVKAGLNILLTDYHRLFCDDALLPAGRLRESERGKHRAQIVVVTKCPPDIKPIDYNIIAKRLRLYPYQRLYFSTFRYGALQAVFPAEARAAAGERLPLSALKGWQVLLLTGIASPAPLREKLEAAAAGVDLLAFGDHHRFTAHDVAQLRERFSRLGGSRKLIVTTEKDAARLASHPALDAPLRACIYALPVEVEILQNKQEQFNREIIDYVEKNTRNRRVPAQADARNA